MYIPQPCASFGESCSKTQPPEKTLEPSVFEPHATIVPKCIERTLELRATVEPLTGPKGLREPEATLEPRVHECVRHTSELYRCHVTYIGVTLSPLG